MKEFKDKVSRDGRSKRYRPGDGRDVHRRRRSSTGWKTIEQRMQDILTGRNPAVVPSPELMQKLNALRPR